MSTMGSATPLAKQPSGIAGLDDLTGGGYPQGRPTLVCGGAGCGKSILGMQFLVSGARDHGEAGIFLSFEEPVDDIVANAASLGWDLPSLVDAGKLLIDHVVVERNLIEEAGDYSLDGLFIRLGAAIDRIGATRVVIDTLEVLFSALANEAVVRAELTRLFRWLKDRGVTCIVTAERGDGSLTRHGLEEYVSDCVILLDHRVIDEISTRRLRIVKYRGSAHVTDETPFMIDRDGFHVLPASSLRLEHEASTERVSSGIPRLDAMLGGGGFYRASSILVSGTPGSGKTTIAASFAAAACARGEQVLYFAFEESPSQLRRNLASIGLGVQDYIDAETLRVMATRPAAHGLETHLAHILHEVDESGAKVVVVDPMSAFGANDLARANMLTRLVDLLKVRGVTTMFTTLTNEAQNEAGTQISSMIDCWLSLETIDFNGERNRSLTIIKARGTGHSNQIREFVITSNGVELVDVYTGVGPVLMGTARLARQAADAAEATTRAEAMDSLRRAIERRTAAVDAQILTLRAELAAEIEAIEVELRRAESVESQLAADQEVRTSARGADTSADGGSR